jgi:dethiobiotin synthetase
MRVVMLGTGTDVGKTYVTERLAAGVRTRASVMALKPIESGVLEGSPGDAQRIARAAGHMAQLSTWRFARPVSPHLAAREQGQSIDVGSVVQWIEATERDSSARLTLIETAGGACSPLAPGVTNIELARALEPALWVLIAPDSLGVLHDVTATLRALPRPPDAVVLTAARPRDASSGSNARELETLKIAPVLCVVERDGAALPVVEWVFAHPHFSPDVCV